MQTRKAPQSAHTQLSKHERKRANRRKAKLASQEVLREKKAEAIVTLPTTTPENTTVESEDADDFGSLLGSLGEQIEEGVDYVKSAIAPYVAAAKVGLFGEYEDINTTDAISETGTATDFLDLKNLPDSPPDSMAVEDFETESIYDKGLPDTVTTAATIQKPGVTTLWDWISHAGNGFFSNFAGESQAVVPAANNATQLKSVPQS